MKLRGGLSGGSVQCDLFRLPIPVNLSAFAIATRRHDNRNRVGESRVDVAIRSLAAAHTAEPIISVIFEVVVLLDGRRFGMTGDRYRFGLSFA